MHLEDDMKKCLFFNKKVCKRGA